MTSWPSRAASRTRSGTAPTSRRRALEIISPGGFERYFAELAPLVTQCPPDLAGIAALAERYGLDMDPESIGVLCEREGLRPPGA